MTSSADVYAYRIWSDFGAPQLEKRFGEYGCIGDALVTDEECTPEYWADRDPDDSTLTTSRWRQLMLVGMRSRREAEKILHPRGQALVRGLPKLGCVIGVRGRFLIVRGELPIGALSIPGDQSDDTEGAALFMRREIKYGSCLPDDVAHLCVWAERSDLSEAFSLLSDCEPELGPPDPWGWGVTPDLYPRDEETPETWAQRVAVSAEAVHQFIARLEQFEDPRLALAAPSARANVGPQFLVDGYFPLGALSMIAAQSGVGKSTVAHQLLHLVSCPVPAHGEKRFLGQLINGQYPAALISAEEPDDIFQYRRERFQRSWPNADVAFFGIERSELKDTLEVLLTFARSRRGRPGAVVIDSVRAFIDGDDTKTHIVTEFQTTLVDFARASGWAVILLHHTTKSPAKSIAQLRVSIAGSEAQIGYSRIAFGMIDRGSGIIEWGPVKTNLPGELLVLKVGESVVCRQDETTYALELVQSDDRGAKRASGDDIELLVIAIDGLNRGRRLVRLSGKDGLWEHHLPLLNGLSRAFIQQGIKSLIASGRIASHPDDGLLVVEIDTTRLALAS